MAALSASPAATVAARISGPAAASAREGRQVWKEVFRNPMAVAGALVVVAWVAVSALAPVVAPYDPIDLNVDNRLAPPSLAHWLGVDGLGRDVLSRLLYGGRVSLPVAAVVVVLASIFGTVYGGLAAYLGSWPDEVAMRVVDMVLAFPSLILAMAIAAALGPSIQNSMLAMLVVWWPPYARVARGQVLALKARDFVAAAQALGLGERRILLRHILPNAVAPSLVLMAMDFGNAIIITAALSFLGLGAVPPTPEWGAMVAEGRELVAQWWIATFPGVAILMVAIACNFVGDALRDAIDPRLRIR
ncbi:MAG TPA: ABC transporter permease [Methylomirabilota bacterium]|jgi:peptide/nickel transport system permease protein|nr:ABC transporter permease [Methylomirabilota bacterium]